MDSVGPIRLMQGNEAVVEGAMAVGMEFYAGYPITPSTEIAELSADRLPEVGGVFIQMEDEIAGVAAAIGASLAGKKAMTATSGPGFSLKQETLGFAMMAEVPLVVVDVQRGGPSTGLPTAAAQGDVMQAKWGTHGDHPVIALCPASVEEAYHLTIRAFNLAEKYRTPVFLMMDEIVAHLRERVTLLPPEAIQRYDRKKPQGPPEDYLPYKVEDGEWVPPMAVIGSGYRHHVTGLFHDEAGFPISDPVQTDNKLNRMLQKVTVNRDEIIQWDYQSTNDPEYILVSYGCSARAAEAAFQLLKKEGRAIGFFRLITLWPFPEEVLRKVLLGVKGVLVVEMNAGQMVQEVARISGGIAPVFHMGKANGELPTPHEIAERIRELGL